MIMAAGDFVGLEVQGIEELVEALKKLPPEVQDFVTEDINKYMLNVLRAYPPPKYVTRKHAYGRSFFTKKQRRWFFWALANNKIQVPYRRTQETSRSWKQVGEGRRSFLANEAPGAPFLYNEPGQSRHEKLVGWKTIPTIIKERTARIIKVAEAATQKAIRKLDLG